MTALLGPVPAATWLLIFESFPDDLMRNGTTPPVSPPLLLIT
jgi:hypothetical protein